MWIDVGMALKFETLESSNFTMFLPRVSWLGTWHFNLFMVTIFYSYSLIFQCIFFHSVIIEATKIKEVLAHKAVFLSSQIAHFTIMFLESLLFYIPLWLTIAFLKFLYWCKNHMGLQVRWICSYDFKIVQGDWNFWACKNKFWGLHILTSQLLIDAEICSGENWFSFVDFAMKDMSIEWVNCDCHEFSYFWILVSSRPNFWMFLLLIIAIWSWSYILIVVCTRLYNTFVTYMKFLVNFHLQCCSFMVNVPMSFKIYKIGNI